MSTQKQPRAAKDDLAEIRAGYWDGLGDISRLVSRLYFSLRDARAEVRALKREIAEAWNLMEEES